MDQDLKAAKQAGLGGSPPAFLLNVYFVSGAQPFRVFHNAIQLALKGSGGPFARRRAGSRSGSDPAARHARWLL